MQKKENNSVPTFPQRILQPRYHDLSFRQARSEGKAPGMGPHSNGILIIADTRMKRVFTVSSDHGGLDCSNNFQLRADCWNPFDCLRQCLEKKKTRHKLEARKAEQQGNLKSTISFSKMVFLCNSPLSERDIQLSLSLLAKRAITRTSFEKGNYLRDHSQIPLSPRTLPSLFVPHLANSFIRAVFGDLSRVS